MMARSSSGFSTIPSSIRLECWIVGESITREFQPDIEYDIGPRHKDVRGAPRGRKENRHRNQRRSITFNLPVGARLLVA